jgi:hypothetical protein
VAAGATCNVLWKALCVNAAAVGFPSTSGPIESVPTTNTLGS